MMSPEREDSFDIQVVGVTTIDAKGQRDASMPTQKHVLYSNSALVSADKITSAAISAADGTSPLKSDMWKKQHRSVLLQPLDSTGKLQCDTFCEVASPSSSTSTADATFEPTIDMMVNDFDDEQTLNDEEALAALESQDAHDEIATLKEESEMPLDELLAKYGPMAPMPVKNPSVRTKKSIPNRLFAKQHDDETAHMLGTENIQNPASFTHAAELLCDVIVIESGDEGDIGCGIISANDKQENAQPRIRDEHMNGKIGLNAPERAEQPEGRAYPAEFPKKRRSHLMDLYPEENFPVDVKNGEETGRGELSEKATGKGLQDELASSGDDEEDEDDYADTESDYIRKIIMVGTEYQATIPGMQQYGDVLPYENEDKLIWEPSQVSELEVEDYLQKATRDAKSAATDNEQLYGDSVEPFVAGKHISSSIGEKRGEQTPPTAASEGRNSGDMDTIGVVKDNEQALHMLVQCGYDFNEALRRRRLNAAPLTGSMSLWSEDECSKFEEGILKFGKDFYKIRQNQVRTRTMRELVQFYYLWKKSDRRDHDFANSNTVDHMDIYLDEGEDFGTSSGHPSGAIAIGTPTNMQLRNPSIYSQNNFSRLTGSGSNNICSTSNNSIFCSNGGGDGVDGTYTINGATPPVGGTYPAISGAVGCCKISGGSNRRRSGSSGISADGHMSNKLLSQLDGQ